MTLHVTEDFQANKDEIEENLVYSKCSWFARVLTVPLLNCRAKDHLKLNAVCCGDSIFMSGQHTALGRTATQKGNPDYFLPSEADRVGACPLGLCHLMAKESSGWIADVCVCLYGCYNLLRSLHHHFEYAAHRKL